MMGKYEPHIAIKEWLFQVCGVFVQINKNSVPGAPCEMHSLAGNERNASEMTLRVTLTPNRVLEATSSAKAGTENERHGLLTMPSRGNTQARCKVLK